MGGAQEMHTAATSILIANMLKSFILSQFKLAHAPQMEWLQELEYVVAGKYWAHGFATQAIKLTIQTDSKA